MNNEEPSSLIANMMSGISWEGKNVNKKYRDGGRGIEEVLTTEVLLGLEFLPRRPFTMDVVENLSRGDSSSPFLVDQEVDSLRFLPRPSGRHALRPTAPNHQTAIDVQFDAIAETDQSRIFVEAKKIGRSSFQEEQLARTYMIALRESGDLKPRVLLLLGSPPPVNVKNVGRVGVREGILARLEDVYKKAECIDFSPSYAKERIDECVAWMTWNDVAQSVRAAMHEYDNGDPSTYASVERLAGLVQESVQWHARALTSR